MQIPLKM